MNAGTKAFIAVMFAISAIFAGMVHEENACLGLKVLACSCEPTKEPTQ